MRSLLLAKLQSLAESSDITFTNYAVASTIKSTVLIIKINSVLTKRVRKRAVMAYNNSDSTKEGKCVRNHADSSLIKMICRLVQKQHRWTVRKRTGNLDSLLLPTRKRIIATNHFFCDMKHRKEATHFVIITPENRIKIFGHFGSFLRAVNNTASGALPATYNSPFIRLKQACNKFKECTLTTTVTSGNASPAVIKL